MKPWQAVSIPSEDSSFTSALGISKERRTELMRMLEKILKSNDLEHKSEILEHITGECQNINEACFVSFVYGEFNKCFSCSPEDFFEKMMSESLLGMIVKIKRKIDGEE